MAMAELNGNHLPKSLHFVGVGGIGMSALAQMSVSLGIKTTGSDRAAQSPENARIINALKAQGIQIFPQDGSVYDNITPDALVYSTAIEESNPDFAKAPAGTPRLHRSKALELLVEAVHAKQMISVAGTCGKTSVTAHVSEALFHLNCDPGMLCGGLVNQFESPILAGNYRHGSGNYFVVEADESDKSLLNYTADTAMVLNIGTDHFPKDVLAEVFRQFIRNTRKNIVLAATVLDIVGQECCAGKNVYVFNDTAEKYDCPYPVASMDEYFVRDGAAYCAFDGQREIRLRAPGHYNALNALAVYALLRLLKFEPEAATKAVGGFTGVWRRFDHAGKLESGADVYDDYAHNVEKIMSCYEAAREIASGKVYVLFQPHGYGPFGFMREPLFDAVERNLKDGDFFGIFPVYYAGGTSSFTPKAEDVIAGYISQTKHPGRYAFLENRDATLKFLKENAKAGDVVLICGARDNSLSDWAKKISKNI